MYVYVWAYKTIYCIRRKLHTTFIQEILFISQNATTMKMQDIDISIYLDIYINKSTVLAVFHKYQVIQAKKTKACSSH